MSESEPGSERKPDPSESGAVVRPESEEDTQPMPLPAPAATAAPSATGAAAPSATKPSLFDTGWDSLLDPKTDGSTLAPPASPSPESEPAKASGIPSFLPPTGKPRTSDESGAVSGEFGGPKVPSASASAAAVADTSSDKPEAPVIDDAPPAVPEAVPERADAEATTSGDDEQGDDEQDDDEQDDDEQDDDEQDDDGSAVVPPKAANDKPIVASPEAQPPGGSRNLLLILGVAAAVVLGIVLFNNMGPSEPAGSGSTRPNTPVDPAKSAKQDHKPQPRPPVVNTHAADPKLEALREKQAREAATGGEQPTDEQVGDGDPETAPPAPAPPKQVITDPRDPSLIPPGTPAENAKAFTKLPVSVSDGPPIGGIGRNGIHIDEIMIGKGRNNSECNNPTSEFSTTDTEFINVCIRVVHSREHDTLRVIWERDGAVTRRSTVGIPQNLHAYKTRSYLQMRPEYVGSWRVRIVPEGEEDTNLAVAEFTIE